MSEKQDHEGDLGPKKLAELPTIKGLLTELEKLTGCTDLFILGAGTPEQEAEYAERQAREDREQREKWEKEHSPGIDGWALLAMALGETPEMLRKIVRDKVSGSIKKEV